MASIQNKAHISLDGYLFMISRNIRKDSHIYGREEAPHFVNKFSSGDPNYRDSTFFPHFVQNNWLNGFDQEKFNDGGKFYRSSAVDTTNQEKLTLQKRFSTTGVLTAGVKVKVMDSWRAAATSAFGDGSDGALTISANTTDSPIDATCTGTSGASTLSATNASFAAGQIILIHQTQGTGAGNYQKNKILSYSAGTITLETALNATYGTGAQVLVMKQYTTITVNSAITWTAKAWDGSLGGILAVMANSTVTLTGTISANGKGFRGGSGQAGATANQGEGVSGTGSQLTSANGQGGGGGTSSEGANQYSNGGGGGGHAISGTAGSVSGGGGTAGSAGGTNGNATLTTMLFGGGGGGGGRGSGVTGTPGSGAAGGGIIFLFVKTPTVTGGIQTNGTAATGATDEGSGGGGGAGGSVLIKTSTAVLGTTLVTATGGAGQDVTSSGADGGAGATGRIHIDYSTSFTGTTNPTLDSLIDSTLTDTPGGSNFTLYAGTANGKIYSWDGATTWTEQFDTRRLKWFDTVASGDTDYFIGDQAGTERAQAQSFQLDAATKVKAIEVYIKKANGTPSDLQVRIETNNAGVPSGTLANANLTKTVPVANITTTYGFVTVEFDSASDANLAAATTYHIVLKTAAAANDQNYNWKADASSPSYTGGQRSHSADGGSTWTADSAADFLFRILGEATEVNAILITDISGTNKMYFGSGDPTGINNTNARLYSFDGTTWVLVKTFNTTNESSVLSMAEFGETTRRVYIGLGHRAKIYSTTDFSTFTLSKTITVPNNPGYVFALQEYNSRLYAGGGYPEQLNNNNSQYGGFLYSYDEFSWNKIGEFEHTVIKSLEIYDNLLFIGTIKKHFYVYNTASIDKLFTFPWDVQITDMIKWDDKLTLAIAETPGTAVTGNEGIYLFDRNGFHNAFNATDREWHSVFVFNNNLMGGNENGDVYQTSSNTYQASGTMQQSYFEASLPNIDKKWRSITLLYESLPSGCSILAEYKTDEADASWTNIGTANTVGSVLKEINFGDTFYSKKISILITLATTNSANTPTLKVMDIRYVLMPEFKYLWKMKIACPDNLIWLDGTEPITTTSAAILAGATSISVVSTSGFPTKGRAVIVDGSTEDEFTWTGKTATTLTGIPASGDGSLTAHTSTGLTVKITGKSMHKQILTLKQTKQLFAFVDIDEISYTVLFHQYQADDFVVNQTDGLENNVPLTLLEA